MADLKASNNKPNALQYIRTIYLSLAAVIGLVCFIMGASGAVKLVMNVWFPVNNFAYYDPYSKGPCEQPVYSPDGKASTPRTAEEIATCEKRVTENNDAQQKNDFNRQTSESVALTVVGFPIWFLHFWLIQEDWKKRKTV
jgi:hypothetical protein